MTFAVTQMECSDSSDENISRAEGMIRRAAGMGAQVILLQELFENLYFCQEQDYKYLELAREAEDNPMLRRMSALAKELSVVLPVSFFERANQTYFNSVMVIDADGTQLGVYRKMHIPHDPGYWEKFYFTPGDTGFMVWKTRYCNLGVGICWDQWFPEAARIMALMGADVLMYPTAIGSEPYLKVDTSKQWQRTMQGHAAANMIPVCASNRVGTEKIGVTELTFYGNSFIAGPDGDIVAQAGRTEETVLTTAFDLDEIKRFRDTFHVFRDRRPEHYSALLTLDGRIPAHVSSFRRRRGPRHDTGR